MKKIFLFTVLVLLLIVSLCSCSSTKDSAEQDESAKKEKTVWDIIGDVIGIIIAVIVIGFWVIYFLAHIAAAVGWENMLIAILVIIGFIIAIGLLIGGLYVIYTDISPYLCSIIIFLPGLYAFLTGNIGSYDEGDKIDYTHEWRYAGTGRRAHDATIRQVYERYHGSGSWTKKINARHRGFFIFGLIILALGAIIINNNSGINLFNMRLGFFVSLILGLANYTTVNLLLWLKVKNKKILLLLLFLLGTFGMAISVLMYNQILSGLVFQIILYITLPALLVVKAVSALKLTGAID
jgi:hypothetical protein